MWYSDIIILLPSSVPRLIIKCLPPTIKANISVQWDAIQAAFVDVLGSKYDSFPPPSHRKQTQITHITKKFSDFLLNGSNSICQLQECGPGDLSADILR